MFLVAVVALGLGTFYLVAGVQKVVARAAVTSNMARLGVGADVTRLIGAAEIAGAICVAAGPWVAPLGLAASAALAALMLGAMVFHAQAGDYRRISRHRDALAPPLLIVVLFALCALLLS